MTRLATVFCLGTFCIFSFCMPVVCRAEENLTITTYYPSPQGVYKDVRLYPTAAKLPADCDASYEGLMYYNHTAVVGSEARAKICYNNGTGYDWTYDFSGGVSGYWVVNLTQGSIHNGNTNGNVSIGTGDAQAALTVSGPSSDSPEKPLVAAVNKHFASPVSDQWVSFAIFPPNTTLGAYLNKTSMIHTSSVSPLNDAVEGNLMFAAVNNISSISFNVGNYSDPASEVMRMVDPCYDDNSGSGQCPRVGIGSLAPQFPLQVESSVSTGPVALRAVRNGAISGIFNIAPWQNRTDLAFGCYLKEGQWYNDPYEYPPAGSGSHNDRGVKFTLHQTKGALWSSYNNTAGAIGSWNIANDRQLWDLDGSWTSNVTLFNASSVSVTCDATMRGRILYNSTGFYGCTNSGWQQFNN